MIKSIDMDSQGWGRDWELFEHSVRFVPSQFVLGACVARVYIVCNELLEIRPVEILAD